MNFKRKIVSAVMQNILSADPPAAGIPTDTEKVKAQPVSEQAINSKYFFFKLAEVGNKPADINYSQDFNAIVNGATNVQELENLKDKLNSGFMGHADNFSWSYLIVKTNKFNNSIIVYQAPLTPDGKKQNTGRKAFYTNRSPVDNTLLDNFEKDLDLFNDQGIVKLDPSIGIYIPKEPVIDSVVNELLRNPSIKLPGQQDYNNFIKAYSGNYRLYSKDQNKLLRPDFSVANDPFKGSDQEIKNIIANIDKKIQTLKQPQQVQPGAQPQPQQPTQENKSMEIKKPGEQNITVPSQAPGAPQARMGTVNREYVLCHEYHGDFDIVKKVLRDQHEHMEVRKEAQDISAQTGVTNVNPAEVAKAPTTTTQNKPNKPNTSRTTEQIKKELELNKKELSIAEQRERMNLSSSTKSVLARNVLKKYMGVNL